MSFFDSDQLSAYRPTTDGWEDPLPDLRQFAVSQKVRIGGRTFTVRVSGINQRGPVEPDTELVHVWVLNEDELLTCVDLGLREPNCSHMWAYLTTKVTEAVVSANARMATSTGWVTAFMADPSGLLPK